MTRLLIAVALILGIGLATYWIFEVIIPLRNTIQIPLAIFIGMMLGFFIYTQIDNRMGP